MAALTWLKYLSNLRLIMHYLGGATYLSTSVANEAIKLTNNFDLALLPSLSIFLKLRNHLDPSVEVSSGLILSTVI